MNTEDNRNVEYAVFKDCRSGKMTFLDRANGAAVEEFRNRYGDKDLLVSTWSSVAPDMLAPRNYALRFHCVSDYVEKTRVSALEACFYVSEHFSIPQESIEMISNGGGAVVSNNTHAGQNDGKTGPDNADHARERADAGPNDSTTAYIPADISKRADQQAGNNVRVAGRADEQGHDNGGEVHENAHNQRNNADISCVTSGNGCRDSDRHNIAASLQSSGSKAHRYGAWAAEVVVIVPPIVFGGRPTPLMAVINYHLARQMAADGITNVEIDAYMRDAYIPLPNSVNSATDRFVIPLTLEELLYLDGSRIAELSKQPRPEDSMILPRQAPEAAEWFAEVKDEFEKKQRRQNELRKIVRQEGWEIPPCIRRLQRLCLYDHVRLEAYRIVSQFLSFIGASESEIRFQIHDMDRLNPIKNYRELNGIVTFAGENPMLAACQHPLLKRFCPAGGCFIAELIEKYEKPYLFEQTGGKL